MGGDTLVTRLAGETIDEDHINLFNRVLQGIIVGRNSSGAPTAGQDLGTPSIPFGTARITNLILNGLPVDPELITAPLNRIISGKVRATSNFPDFFRPAGSGNGASLTLLATVTPLSYDVNGIDAQFIVDTVKSSLTVAPPANNTCSINDSALAGQDTTKNLGENGTAITVDAMESELTSRVGELVALLNQSTNEIMYCKIDSTTQLTNALRGTFFNSSGNPIERNILNNNDTLQLLSLGFIFIDKDGVTIDVTYRNPAVGGNEPTSPQVGDYWFDISISAWKRYSGVSFSIINRMLAGVVVIDTADCIGARSGYFGKTYSFDNTLKLDLITVDLISSRQPQFSISVDGRLFLFSIVSFFEWLAATDFESGVTRTKDRNYWLYITEGGRPIISDKKPYDLLGILAGWYHPYESWRAVGQIYNNTAGASGEFEIVNDSDKTLELIDGDRIYPGIPLIANSPGDLLHDIVFSPRNFTFDDNTGKTTINEILTKRLDAPWSPGDGGGALDIGSLSANLTYHWFAIYNPKANQKDYLGSLSAADPELPAGFTKKRRVWSILTNAVNNIYPFLQTDKYCYYKEEFDSFSGNVINVEQSIVLDTPNGIQTLALVNAYYRVSTGSGFIANLRLYSTTGNDDAVTRINSQVTTEKATGSVNAAGKSAFEIITNTSTQVKIKADVTLASVVEIGVRGYIDTGLKV